jgi:hypothetical protein
VFDKQAAQAITIDGKRIIEERRKVDKLMTAACPDRDIH